MDERIDVALFGAAGYAGLELVKILAGHPRVRLACAASDHHAGRDAGAVTGAAGAAGLAFVTAAEARARAASCAVALLAVPHEAAPALVRALRAGATPPRIIDLSNAHRAEPGAVYGLASLFATDVADAALVANPGCYATTIITAAAPLVRHGVLDGDVAVVAGSGVTGAGRTATEAMSLGEMYGEVRAYKALRHQHVPEIEAALARVAAAAGRAPRRVAFTPHLLPIARGIFATLTGRLARPMTAEELTELMRADYAGDPTVVVARSAEEVSLRRVVGTSTCLVGVGADERGDVVVTAALDNLLKGAASQAVENLNLMLGLPRTTGLAHLARHA